MSSQHTVQQGEHLARIAVAYGFVDYTTIWDHPRNAELKRRRQSPHVLFPDDVLFIPDRESKEYPRPTEQRHRFRVHRTPLKVILVLEDLYERAIGHAPCDLIVENQIHHLTTDGRGRIEQVIPAAAEHGRLILRDPQTPLNGLEIPIEIGHLDPVDEVSGQTARLNNLGYDAGDPDRADEARLRSAIEEFQCEHGLRVDGICGPATRAKLKDVHGC
jgi:N-acetylmuramoyl-L-alanine amidase